MKPNAIQTLRADLVAQFPERQGVIDGCLAAILSSEHVLLIGPPGTAKSALARSIVQSFGGSYFERLLTKFSTPDEVFGPVSLKGLEQDKFERIIDGKLPTVQFAFIDEAYKANSAILNSLLAIMNERIYHNGAILQCPLVTLFGASNELPEGKDLEALTDRFLVRFEVNYLVQLTALRNVLTSVDPVPSQHMTMDDLREAQEWVKAVKVSDETIEGLIAIREACQAEGIIASDRRWKKSLNLVKAVAYMMGEVKTNPEDLTILVDILWREPKERDKIARIVSDRSDPATAQIREVLDSARETVKRITVLKSKKERGEYVGAAANAIDQFTAQKAQIVELSRSAGKRAKLAANDATIEIQGMHAEATRAISASLGFSDKARFSAVVPST